MDELIPLPSPGVPLEYGDEGRPAVIVLHDEFGRLPWMEPYAEALASRGGFRVLVPDLYDGVATTDDAESIRLSSALDHTQIDGAIDDLIRTARAQGTPRIALVGFGLGGALALHHAQTGSAEAVAAYYATLDTDEHTLIPCPVLLNLAESDAWTDGADPGSFIARLKDHGTPVAHHVYAGTGHSFANASLARAIDSNAAALAFARTTVFLEQHLDG